MLLLQALVAGKKLDCPGLSRPPFRGPGWLLGEPDSAV